MAALRRRLGDAAVDAQALCLAAWRGRCAAETRIDSELANHLDYVDCALQGCKWSVGDTLRGADVQMSLVGEAARGLRASFPNMDAWARRFQQRPA